MLNISKKLYAATSVVIVLSLVFAGNVCFAESATSNEAKVSERKAQNNEKSEKKFEDWSFISEKISAPVPNDKDQKTEVKNVTVHYISNSVHTKEGLRVIRTDMGYFDHGSNKLTLSQTLPFGIDVHAEISLLVEDKKILSGKIFSCYADGCKIITELKKDDLEKVLKSKELTVQMNLIGGQPVSFKISSKGLKKAFEAMKKASGK